MVKTLTEDFETFIDTISLDKKLKNDIIDKHTSLTNMIQEDQPDGYNINRTRISGSYGKDTEINEFDPNKNPDVDIVVILDTDLDNVEQIHKDFYDYLVDNFSSVVQEVRQQSNSIGLKYKNIDVDIVLAKDNEDGSIKITSDKLQTLIYSNCLRQLDYKTEQNKYYTTFGYKKLMKLFKYLNKEVLNNKIKSYTLEMLVHQCVPTNRVDLKILNAFSEWIAKNYGSQYQLHSLVKKGIGIHNGQIHRSLSQLQVKLFEREDGLTNMVSTSSIIEGVNTQAKNVILWSVKNGTSSIDYFTYRNIIGRAGRMFRYFVGNVYLLEMPPEAENTTLELEFPDDVVRSLDGNNPGVRLNNQQFLLIKSYQDEMATLLGSNVWNSLYSNPQIKSCNPTLLKAIALKIKQNPNWPRNYDALTRRNTWDWRFAIEDVIDIANIRRKGQVKTYACLASNGWSVTIPHIYNLVSKYGITMEDMFDYERKISFNFASVLSIINLIKQAVYSNTPDISEFIHRASNAFLPKLVFQLEEYGLPRMISKKIHSSRVINLDDSIEISTVIDKFKGIGLNNLLVFVNGLDDFDRFIIKYFYQGIM